MKILQNKLKKYVKIVVFLRLGENSSKSFLAQIVFAHWKTTQDEGPRKLPLVTLMKSSNISAIFPTSAAQENQNTWSRQSWSRTQVKVIFWTKPSTYFEPGKKLYKNLSCWSSFKNPVRIWASGALSKVQQEFENLQLDKKILANKLSSWSSKSNFSAVVPSGS